MATEERLSCRRLPSKLTGSMWQSACRCGWASQPCVSNAAAVDRWSAHHTSVQLLRVNKPDEERLWYRCFVCGDWVRSYVGALLPLHGDRNFHIKPFISDGMCDNRALAPPGEEPITTSEVRMFTAVGGEELVGGYVGNVGPEDPELATADDRDGRFW